MKRGLIIIVFLLISFILINIVSAQSCQEGTYRCDPTNTLTQVCTNDVWTTSKYCQFGCENSVCLEGCYEDTFRCDPFNANILQTCTNNAWTTYQTCQDGCETNACKGTTCELEDQKRCDPINTNTLQVCKSSSWITFEECDFGCSNNACITCQEGDYKCNANILEICTNNAWIIDQTCENVCENNACVTCQSNQLRCDPSNNNIIQKCMNRNWVTSNQCISGCEDGACIGCREGTYNCNGNVLQICTNNAWTVFEECDFGCENNACIEACQNEGTYRCNPTNNTVQFCKMSSWITSQQCDFGCENNVCKVCTEEIRRCNANTLEICTDNAWTTFEECDYGCSSNACITCQEGTYKCDSSDPNILQICKYDSWITAKQCQNGCSANVCLENKKKADKYLSKEAFLISDENWQDALSLVPITTWTDNEGIHTYPTLIYHNEKQTTLTSWREQTEIKIDGANPEDKNFIVTFTYLPVSSNSQYVFLYDPNIDIEPRTADIFHITVKLQYHSKEEGEHVDYIEITNWPNNIEPLSEGGNKIYINKDFQAGVDQDTLFLSFDFIPISGNVNSFDADSIIYFLQQYQPERLTITGETSVELDNLFIAEPELGAGLSVEKIQRINLNDYLSYWDSFNSVVYVENNYELALLASTYASLINSPLIIRGSSLDMPIVFEGRKIVCIGNIPSSVACNEQYDLESLQKKYVDKTRTDKIILINPADDSGESELFYPEKSSSLITNLHSKASLIAPILASAKHEIILSTSSTNYTEIDEFLENKINTLNIDAKYLTIMSSPKFIPMSVIGNFNGVQISLTRWEIDNKLYGNLNSASDFVINQENGEIEFKPSYQELAVGRIMGLTSSDISAYVARNLFYNMIPHSTNFAMLYQHAEFAYMKLNAKTNDKLLEATGLIKQSIYTDEDEESAFQTSFNVTTDMKDRIIINYLDHGGTGGWSYTDINVNRLKNEKVWMHPSLVKSDACSTCAYEELTNINDDVSYGCGFGDESHDCYTNELFCTNILRRGAIAHIGTVDASYGSFPRYYYELIFNGESIGNAFKKTISYFQLSPLKGYGNDVDRYILLGDPTFNFDFTYPQIEKVSITTQENRNNMIATIHTPQTDDLITYTHPQTGDVFSFHYSPLGDNILFYGNIKNLFRSGYVWEKNLDNKNIIGISKIEYHNPNGKVFEVVPTISINSANNLFGSAIYGDTFLHFNLIPNPETKNPNDIIFFISIDDLPMELISPYTELKIYFEIENIEIQKIAPTTNAIKNLFQKINKAIKK